MGCSSIIKNTYYLIQGETAEEVDISPSLAVLHKLITTLTFCSSQGVNIEAPPQF